MALVAISTAGVVKDTESRTAAPSTAHTHQDKNLSSEIEAETRKIKRSPPFMCGTNCFRKSKNCITECPEWYVPFIRMRKMFSYMAQPWNWGSNRNEATYTYIIIDHTSNDNNNYSYYNPRKISESN